MKNIKRIFTEEGPARRYALYVLIIFLLIGCGIAAPGTLGKAAELRITQAEITAETAVVANAAVATEPAVMTEKTATTEQAALTEPAVVTDTAAVTEPAVVTDTAAATEPAVVTDTEAATEPAVVIETAAGTEKVTASETAVMSDTAALPEPEQDVTAPIIEGVHDLTVEQGKSVSYKKGVSVTDDLDSEVALEIDASQVNLNTPGIYNVFYRAADRAGNQTEVMCTVTVIEPVKITEEEVYALADQLLADIITDDMTQYEQAETLWRWCRDKIAYRSHSDERNVLDGAYQGLRNRSGDCYIYYATYEVLLTRCGIANMCVARVGGSSEHWWNLVNVGDGWYHCDSSPRNYQDKFFISFMQTDEQVAEYSAHYLTLYPDRPNYYGFDGSIYPERATTILVENVYPQ